MTDVVTMAPPIWFLEGVSTLTPYNVALVLLVNHYCTEPSKTKFKLGVILLECIKFRNLSLNQLIALLNELDDSDLGGEFLFYLEHRINTGSIVVLRNLLGNLGSAHALMMNPEEIMIKPSSPFGLFLRHMILSFELASFEQLSMFLQDLKTYIEKKDTVFPLHSTKQQEAGFSREVAKFEKNLSLDRTNAEIHKMCSGGEGKTQQAEFLKHLNFLSVREYCRAREHLHQYFTMMLNSGHSPRNIRPFSALSLAAMHTTFNHNQIALQYIKESVHLGQLLGEESCLSHCIAWTSYLQGAPISRPKLPTESDALPTELEVVGHVHTLEAMCKNGEDPVDVLRTMSNIAPIATRAQYHTNAAQVFRWYGNGLLSELHPFFAVLQLCPGWIKEGHMITLSHDVTALCGALCSLASSLSRSPAVSCTELLNFTLSLFPCFSAHRELILLTLNFVSFTHKRAAHQKADKEAALIRSISRSTHAALTSTEEEDEEGGDVYITSQELTAHVSYNAAVEDLPSTPSRAVQKLLNLILYCQKHHLQEQLIRANLLLAEAQISLKLPHQALDTVHSVFIQALSSNSTLIQSSARFLYAQSKLATCPAEHRHTTFRTLESHLKTALAGFLALSHVRYVTELFYFLARLYDEFGMRDDRNKCAKKFRNFYQNLTIHDPL